jgi:progressive ankylosis protein
LTGKLIPPTLSAMDTTSLRSAISQRSIFLAWLPLAAMWILMAVELPGIAAVIARMDEARKQLAIFGVVFSFALVIESPIVQMLSAGTALGTSSNNYARLLRFMHILGGSLTALHLLVGLTPIFDYLVLDLVGMPTGFLKDSRTAFLLMTPWTAAVGYRRLWQGILIRRDRTNIIPITMVMRLGTSALILTSGVIFRFLPGAALGGLALTGGVMAGAAASFFFLKRELPKMTERDDSISYRGLYHFYYPLALTSFVLLVARPILSAGIARAASPIDSLAAWPVVMGFMFLFNSMALSFQEIVISWHEKPGGKEALGRFALRLGIVLFILFQAVVWTPVSALWFLHISGLEPELLKLLPGALLMLAFTSPMLTFISLERGRLISNKRTGAVSRGVIVNLFFMVTLMFALLLVPGITGVLLAAASFLGSMSAEALYLAVTGRSSSRLQT